jgi:hypothetical protein
MERRNKVCETFRSLSEKTAFGIKWKGIARVVRPLSIRWRVQMDELHDKGLFHPLVAGAAIYLTEVMASVDSSIGRALIMVIGGLALQIYRKLTRCNCRVE